MKRPQGLTASDRQVALMDAHGYGKGEISRQLGVSESTIARLRRNDEYRAEVQRLAQRAGDAMAPKLKLATEEMIDGMLAGKNALLEQLEAEDPDGHPLFGVRQDAAVKLVEAGVKIIQIGAVSADAVRARDAAISPPGRTNITFNLNPKTGEVAVEGDAVEE